ncbi:MAG: hypothetical protein NWQ37_02315, partial [Marivita lacus]|nr:hypothetical protein [Marivita lacus]
DVSSVWVSILLTVGALALFIGLLIAWVLSVSIQSFLAMEIYRQDGELPKKGRHYLKFIEDISRGNMSAYTEEGMVAVARKFVRPFWITTILGYFSLLLLLLTMIWGDFSSSVP